MAYLLRFALEKLQSSCMEVTYIHKFFGALKRRQSFAASLKHRKGLYLIRWGVACRDCGASKPGLRFPTIMVTLPAIAVRPCFLPSSTIGCGEILLVLVVSHTR